MALVRTLVFGLFVLLNSSVHLAALDPCPFNADECLCDKSTQPQLDFLNVDCSSKTGSFVNITVTPGVQHRVGYFYITGDVASLPANYLSSFSYIGHLELNIGSTGLKPQNWHDTAFDGCNVSTLSVWGVDGMLPASPALTKLGVQGLVTLFIIKGEQPIKIPKNQFKQFKFLETLSISTVPVFGIGAQAFAGLEDTLTTFVMRDTACKTTKPRSFSSLLKLRSLTTLYLENTGLTDIPVGAFANFPYLQDLSFSSDPLSAAIEAGALLNLPGSLRTVQLENVSLTKMPNLTFSSAPPKQLNLNLLKNNISELKTEDFQGGLNYGALTFDYNPVSAIETGVIVNGQVVGLSGALLSSVDFSIFGSITKTAYLENAMNLKSLSMSNWEQVYNFEEIEVYPALEIVDASVEQLFIRNPAFKLTLSHNRKLSCENINWMAQYVLCSNQVTLDFAACSNGTPAKTYFENLGYNCTTQVYREIFLIE